MKNIFIAILLLSTAWTIGGCTKGGNLQTLTGATYMLTGTADGTQLVPANSVTSTGNFTGYYDEQVNDLTFTLAWTNLWTAATPDAITGVSLYAPAAKGSNGTLIHTIPVANSANLTGTINLALAGNKGLLTAERDALYSGLCYYVITTTKYPNGIIRGQLSAVKR